MTVPTPEEIERLAARVRNALESQALAGLDGHTVRMLLVELGGTLATIQRERDEARRMLAEADIEAARLRENARAAKRRLAAQKEG